MCKHWTQEGGGQVGASEDMKKKHEVMEDFVFLGVVVCEFASSGWRAGEVGLDSLVQEYELAKLVWIRQFKSVS